VRIDVMRIRELVSPHQHAFGIRLLEGVVALLINLL
jgi:hypothetical protein